MQPTRGVARRARKRGGPTRNATGTQDSSGQATPGARRGTNASINSRGTRNVSRVQRGSTRKAPTSAPQGTATTTTPLTKHTAQPTTSTEGTNTSNLPYAERFQLLKQERERERTDAIANGFLADPDKPRSLADAITPVGVCQDMCPEWERVERIVQKDVWTPETDPSQHNLPPPQRQPDEARMVKKFRRAAAGIDEQLPSDLRPPTVLQKTIDYLFNDVIGQAETLASVHHFVWDRTRAIRNDFSIQQVTKASELRIAMDCYERIARFHILSLHQLALPEKPYDKYDAQQEREQLDKTLLSLIQYYDDSRGRVQSPNEAEFRAYCILFQIQDPTPDLEDRVQNWPKDIIKNSRVQRALKLYASACTTLDSQGPLRPRTNHPIAQANWKRFWALIDSDEISYLMGCVAEIYFGLIRRTALNAIWQAFRQGGTAKNEDWTLSELIDVLGFYDEDEVQDFCEKFGFVIGEKADGAAYLDLTSVSGKSLPDPPSSAIAQSRSQLVEQKRCNRILPAVIDGLSYRAAEKAGALEEPALAEDLNMDDSLFVNDDSDAEKQTIFTSQTTIPEVKQPIQAISPETQPQTSISTASMFESTDTKPQNPFKFPSSQPGLSLPQTTQPLNPFASPWAPAPQTLQESQTQNPFKQPAVPTPPIPQNTQPKNPFGFTPLPTTPFATSNETSRTLFSNLPSSNKPLSPNNAKSQPLFSFPSQPNESPKSNTGTFQSLFNFTPKPTAPSSNNDQASKNFFAPPSQSAMTTAPEPAATSSSPFTFSNSPALPSTVETKQPQTSFNFASPSSQPSTTEIKPPPSHFTSYSGSGGAISKPTTSASLFNFTPQTSANPEPPVKQSTPPIFVNAPVSTTKPPTQTKGPSPAELEQQSKKRKERTFDKIAELVITEPRGFLEQFVEFTAGPLITKLKAQVVQEKINREADEFRVALLSRRYGTRWRDISWKRRLARVGKERRQRFKEAQARANKSRESSIDADYDALRRSRNGTSQNLSKPSLTNGIWNTSMSPPDRPRQPSQEEQNSRQTSSFMGSQSLHRRTKSSIEQPSSTPHRASYLTSSWSSRQPKSMVRRSPLSNEYHSMSAPPPKRIDTTRSTYFKLKALGIDPRSGRNVLSASVSESSNRSRKRSRRSDIDDIDISVEDDSAAMLPPPRKRSQTASSLNSPESVVPSLAMPDLSPAPGTSKSALTPEDEELFAAFRSLRAEIDDSITFFREEVAKDKIEEEQQQQHYSSSHRHSRSLREPIYHNSRGSFAASSNSGLSGRNLLGRQKEKKPPPAYRSRPSKFLPREMYADVLMAKRGMSTSSNGGASPSLAQVSPSSLKTSVSQIRQHAVKSVDTPHEHVPEKRPPVKGLSSVTTGKDANMFDVLDEAEDDGGEAAAAAEGEGGSNHQDEDGDEIIEDYDEEEEEEDEEEDYDNEDEDAEEEEEEAPPRAQSTSSWGGKGGTSVEDAIEL